MSVKDSNYRMKKSESGVRKTIVWTILKWALFFLVLFLLFRFVFVLVFPRTDNMAPAIYNGDLTLGYRLDKSYISGDVVLYQIDDGEQTYGRIVALPGNTVEVDSLGYLKVNGQVFLKNSEQIRLNDMGEISYPIVLEPETYFILNDNLEDTTDSRTFGAVNSDQIMGKLLFLARRRNF